MDTPVAEMATDTTPDMHMPMPDTTLMVEIHTYQDTKTLPNLPFDTLPTLTTPEEQRWDYMCTLDTDMVWTQAHKQTNNTQDTTLIGEALDIITHTIHSKMEPDGLQVWKDHNRVDVANWPDAFRRLTHLAVAQGLENDMLYMVNIPITGKGWTMEPNKQTQKDLWMDTCQPLPLGVNINSVSTLINLHVDGGFHGFSQALHLSKCLWVTFPPTVSNMQTYYTYPKHPNLMKLAMAMGMGKEFNIKLLEGGRMAILDSIQVMYLPPGCMHMTITLKTRALVGIVYSSPESITTCEEMLEQAQIIEREKGDGESDMLEDDRRSLENMREMVSKYLV